jgi:3',5'-cyclic AMP phosphodiesterase CpdA
VATLTDRWRPQFTLPENGPPDLAETVYYLDYQGTRIISLNSNEKQAEQALWLDDVLQNNPCRWSIITFHHPIYSAARSRDNVKLRSQWQPILDKHRVDLVLQGHDHAYARSGMISAQDATTQNQPIGVTQQSDTAGTVYVVSVSGPKMYDLDKPYRSQFQRVAEDVQLFQIISIDDDELHYEARTATGTLYDGFTLKKRDGRPNEMTEQIPATPQRVRETKPVPTGSRIKS